MIIWKRTRLEREFWIFHKAHPQVYAKLREMALARYASGKEMAGISELYEQLRWTSRQITGDPYKFSNNHRAYYSRLLMALNPQLRHFFVIKPVRSDFA